MYDAKDENLMRLIKKIKENPQSFIFIVGAGMSQPSGLPNWTKLAKDMINYYEHVMQNVDESTKIKCEELRTLNNLWDVFSELKRSLSPNDYNKYIKENLSDKGRTIPYNYKLIWQLDVCEIGRASCRERV